MKKKVFTTLIVIVVIAGMILIARILVNNFDVMEFLKKLHGY
ncbi:MAG TPA: hypothetical protein VLT51_01020 [Anaerolineales bacterium]|nr:hypothetical protein [Anaerolineales bacterium]